MPNPTVLITDYAWPDLDRERSILAPLNAHLLVAERGDEAELIGLAPQATAILTCWQKVTPAVLDAAPNCIHVSRYGVGLDNIAVEHATALGIVVTNVPDFCVEEVSDHAMALILACARRVVGFDRAVRAGTWNNTSLGPLPRLRGQTLGLVGFGNSARALLPKAKGFGMRVIAYTPRLSPTALQAPDVATNDLAFLLRESDYISLHAPLTPETQHLINAETLRHMKPSAFIINTARGALIDEAALASALHEGSITGAALDVLSQEPPPTDHPLLRMDNVIVTPHAAFYSSAAIAELAEKAARHVAQSLQGQQPDHIVNPAVLTQANLRLTRQGA
ncbi:MAG TPA: C-terminal binding protein [Caldilineaceae bacterium]|nr:C-terminal binding protein [Caldilineaceae bacterium]